MNEARGLRRPLAVITASYSGIGAELSKRLAQAGYDLVLINRDQDRTNKQLRELEALAPSISVIGVAADLSDHQAMRFAASQIAERHSQVDVLIHNAGALTDRLVLSSQGNDVHYEVNTVAPFLLTEMLRTQLAASEGAVVVAVGSSAMKMARRLDLTGLRKPVRFKKFAPYAQSKLATAAAFRALAADYANDGISLRVVDPGPAKTSMSNSPALPGWFRLFRRFFALPEAGAARIYEAATAPRFAGKSGIYIERGKIARLPASASDPETQKRLLALLRETTM
ncbi:SDR family NAD(P)-dependent oxidoreductase [Paenibacillus sp. NEAU-GSW1]|uniref:SDR family NAD(P)-dependent oxidoreductase n=1 Tax=Paenibacillus sp. NEAU-GSW1 TaxID=2682486 RepID=UPI0012E29044|nr:SDR family NAD(P)-dependent oxidoreductase [Paenibacillus sp. NEAU-GSW1]MUT64662.1 SDR family NAD(P)-dependent oxidoreductase [Paenibacillus sp. NEAU-GSW1]